MKLTASILFILAYALLERLLQGLVQPVSASQIAMPEKPDSVLPYRNNEAAEGKYSFFFKLSTPVPQNPFITIDFPSTYPKLVKDVDNCRGRVEVLLRSEKFTMPCTILGNQVIFDLTSHWTQIDAGNIAIELFDVVNPAPIQDRSGGNFAIRTWSGLDIVIDENVIFTAIGFAPQYQIFSSVNIFNDGANIAGYTINYIVEFTAGRDYPVGTWFRLLFPDGFSFGEQLQCYVENFSDEALAQLPCSADEQTLVMKDLKQPMTSGSTYRIKLKNIKNPHSATPQTGNFLFESMKEGVYTVLEHEASVPGIAISPGTVTDASVKGVPLVQNYFAEYEIRFLPSNTVPEGGVIEMQFPSTFQGLGSTCRVIEGPEGLTEGNLPTCETVGDKVFIKNFKNFDPKYVTVKVDAYNPPVQGETPFFKAKTYTDESLSQIIDQNDEVGTVFISSIDRPNFVGTDFYRPIIPCTWLERKCPIDFRFFPNPENTLKQSKTNSDYGNMVLQIPIWWRLDSDNNQPQCQVGDIPTERCQQREHDFSIQTTDSAEYGPCELPISVKYTRKTPIPGKYPWRLVSFDTGGKWYPNNHWKKPIEQDTYIMDLPVVSISVLQPYASGSQSIDEDNLLHVRCNMHPFLFSYQGALMFNLTHVEDSLDDRAAWPVKGGQTVADNAEKEIGCKVYIRGRNAGYGALKYDNDHPNVRCYVKTQDSSSFENTIIHIVGFSFNMEKGNWFEVYVPNIQYCSTIGRQCRLNVGFTMTHSINVPYLTNNRSLTLGTVLGPATGVDAPVSPPGGNRPNRNRVKCAWTNLDIRVDIPKVIRVGDYVILKRNITHWHFLYYTTYDLQLESGTRMRAIPILMKDEDKEYIVLWMKEEIKPKNNYRFLLRGIFNTPYAYEPAIIGVVLWSGRKKQVVGDIQPSYDSLPGGIHDINTRWEDALGDRDLYTQNWYYPMRIRFSNCMQVPSTGSIEIKLTNRSPNTLMTEFGVNTSINSTCRVWKDVQRMKINETEVSCTYDAATSTFTLKEFDEIPKRLRYIHMSFHVDTLFLKAIQKIHFEIETFNITGDASTRTDWIDDGQRNNNGRNYLGWGHRNPTVTHIKAPHFEAISWRQYYWEMYESGRGGFFFDIEVGDAMPYTLGEGNYFEFVTHGSVEYNAYHLECQYGEATDALYTKAVHFYPSVDCDYVNTASIDPATQLITGITTITMKLHPMVDIAPNGNYKFFVDTRYQEVMNGLQFKQYGIYTLSINNYVNGVMQRSGKKVFEVYGDRIAHFFVYSANKVFNDQTFFTIWLDFRHDSPNRFDYEKGYEVNVGDSIQQVIVYFKTSGIEGFKKDLGTGFADQSVVPCKSHYLKNIKNVPQKRCRLFYGYNGAPARIIIDQFEETRTQFNRFDIPAVINPDQTGIVPRVWLKIIRKQGQLTRVLKEGHYYELNTTWIRNIWYPITQADSMDSVTMTTTDLDTFGTLTLPLRTPDALELNDFILFKFPKWWPMLYDINGQNDCKGLPIFEQNCYAIRNDAQDAHYLYAKVGGNLANGASLKFNIHSSRSVIFANNTDYIESFIFHHTRMIGNYKYKNLQPLGFIADPIEPKINCLPIDPIQGTNTEYIINFELPHNLLSKAEIRIDFPDYLMTPSVICSSTTNSMLTGQVLCDILGPVPYSRTYNFEDIEEKQIVDIKIPLKNPPATGAKNSFQIRTYYIKDDGFYYLNGDSGLIEHENNCTILATPPATAVPWPQMWHKMPRTRCEETGPIKFHFRTAQTLRMNTPDDYIIISIPKTFEKVPGQLVPQWLLEDFSSNWVYTKTDPTHHIIRFSAPKTFDIEANKDYLINITTANGIKNVNGFIYPDTQSIHYAKVEVFVNNVKVEEGSTKIYVFQKNFAQFESASYLMNSNHKASFRMKLQVDAPQGANGKFIFKLPTTTYTRMNRIDLFSDDGGSGLASGQSINCHLIKGTVWDTSVLCTFYKGSQDLATPARVEMTNVPAMAITDIMTLVFDGFTHPELGDDDKNVESSVEYYDSGNTHVYTGIDYDYTIVQDPSFDVMTGYEAPLFAATPIGAVNTNFDIKFRSPVDLHKFTNANGQGWADYLIVEFPEGFKIEYEQVAEAKLMSGPSKGDSNWQSLEFSSGNRWIIWRVDIATLKKNSEYKLRMKKVDQAKSMPTDRKIKMFIVSKRELVREIVYSDLQTIQSAAITPAEMILTADEVQPDQVPKGKYQRWKLDFGHATNEIPRGGVIKVELSSEFTEMDEHCYNAPDTQLVKDQENEIFCKWDPATNAYYITNFDTNDSSKRVRIFFYAKNKNASGTAGNNGSVSVTTFKDAAMQFQLLEGSVNVPEVKNFFGFEKLAFSTEGQEIPDVVRAGEAAPFEIDVAIPTGWTDASTIVVTFPVGVTVPADGHLVCSFGQLEARRCTVTQPSPLQVTVMTPHQPALTIGDKYHLVISSTCGAGNARGLTYATMGDYEVSVDVGGVTSPTTFRVYGEDFSDKSFRTMYSNKNADNAVYVKTKVSQAVPAGGVIRFKLPRMSKGGSTLLWGSMGAEQGEELENVCSGIANLVASNSVLGCKYYQEEFNNVWEMHSFNALSAGTSIEFIISKIVNTDADSDIYNVDAILQTADATGVVLNEGVLFDVFSILDTTSTTSAISQTVNRSGKNALRQGAVDYRMGGITINPAIKADDQVVFEFSEAYFFSAGLNNCLTSSTAGSYKGYGRYVVFKPSAAISGTKTFCFGSSINPFGNDKANFNIYVVYSRGFTKKYTYKNANYDLASVTPTVTETSLVAGAGSKYSLSIDSDALIPAYGAINIELPAGFTYQGLITRSGLKPGASITVSGNIITLKTSQLYSKNGGDGVLEMDLYLENPAADGDYDIEISAAAIPGIPSQIWSFTYTMTIVPGASVDCYLEVTPLSSAISATNTWNIFVAASETASVAAPAIAGYDMISHSNCRGLPLYTVPACTMPGSIVIGHPSLTSAANELNYASYTGSTGDNFVAKTDILSFDFGNHDSPDLGTTLTTGDSISCHVEAAATPMQATCTLRTGSQSMSPGIEIRLLEDVASGSAITVAVAGFSNPATIRPMEVRLRHVRNTQGNHQEDLCAVLTEFSITPPTVPPTTGTGTINFGASTAQSMTSANIDIGGSAPGDQVIIFSPKVQGGLTTYPAGAPTYFDSNFVQMGTYIKNTGTGATFTENNFQTPSASTLIQDYIAIVVNAAGTEVLQVVTLTPSSVDECAVVTSDFVALTQNSASGIAQYEVSWDTTCELPFGSKVTIALPAYATNVQVAGYKLLEGTVNGKLSLGVASNSIEIKAYTSIAPGPFRLRLWASASIGSGATGASITASLKGSNIFSASHTIAKLTSSNLPVSERYRDYLFKPRAVQVSQYGYLQLFFKTQNTIGNTDQFHVYPPTTFGSGFSFYTRCKFTDMSNTRDLQYYSSYCFWNAVNKRFEIKKPQNINLSNTKLYRLDLFHIGEQNFGIRHPATPQAYEFGFELANAAGTSTKEKFVTKLPLREITLPNTCFKNFLSNVDKTNVFMMRFEPASNIPISGFLRFYLPTSVLKDGLLTDGFARNLGTSLFNRQSIKCKSFTYAAGAKSASGAVDHCELVFGGANHIHREAYIDVKLAQAMNTGTTYVVDLYGLVNPSTAEIGSYLRMEAGSYAGSIELIKQTHYEPLSIYTSDPTVKIEAGQSLPALAPTEIQLATNFDLTVSAAPAVPLLKDFDHVRMEYNPDMINQDNTATDFEPFVVEPGLNFYYSEIDRAANFDLQLSDMNTPDNAKAFLSSFKVQLIKDKVLHSEISYAPNGNSFDALIFTSVVYEPTFDQAQANGKNVHVLSVTTSKKLTKGGSIELEVMDMASIDPLCQEATSVLGNDFKCLAVSPTKVRISGYPTLPAGTNFKINLRALASAATTGRVCATAFDDNPTIPAAPVAPVQLEVCAPLVYNAFPAVPIFWSETRGKQWRIQAEERGRLLFKFDATTMVPQLTGYIKIHDPQSNIDHLGTKDFRCFFNFRVAKDCYYQNSDKSWYVYAPRINDLVGEQTLTISSYRQFYSKAVKDGIWFSEAGSYPAVMTAHNNGGATLFTDPHDSITVPPHHFGLIEFNSYLIKKNTDPINPDAYSTYHLRMRVDKLITAFPNGQIKIEFKAVNRYTHNVFRGDIGTGSYNGQDYECPGVTHTGAATFKCRLFLGNENTPASIIIDPSANLVIGDEIEMDFPSLLNPDVDYTEVKTFIRGQNYDAPSKQWIIVQEYVNDIFVAREFIIAPVPGISRTFSNGLVGQPGLTSFKFQMDAAKYGAIKGPLVSFDKIVLKANNPLYEFLNYQNVTGKELTCAGFTLKIFYATDMVEFTPLAEIPAGTTIDISCLNFFNMQYVIRGGIDYTIEIWIDGEVAEIFEFPNYQVTPNIVFDPKVIYPSEPNDAETSAFNAYKISFKPYNYIPEGGRFEIFFPDGFSGITNCELVSGLNGGVCKIEEDQAGFDYIKVENFRVYKPEEDPEIALTFDMNNIATPGTIDFKFRSIWKQKTPAALEDLIDEYDLGQVIYSGLPGYIYLKVEELHEFVRDAYPVYYDEGVYRFKMAFSENLEYLQREHMYVSNWHFSRNYWEYQRSYPKLDEFICYFHRDKDLFSAKSEYCNYAGGSLTIWPSEEAELPPGNRMMINVEWRGASHRGVTSTRLPRPEFYDVTTNRTSIGNEVGKLELDIRPGYFRHRDMKTINWNSDEPASLEVSNSVYLRISDIRTTKWDGNDFRMQALYSQTNEIKFVAHTEMGHTNLTADFQSEYLPCNWYNSHLKVDKPSLIYFHDVAGWAHRVPTTGVYDTNWPVPITMRNITNYRDYSNFSFRFGWAVITNFHDTLMTTPAIGSKNTTYRNTYVHMTLSSQYMLHDGTWLETHRLKHWRHIVQLRDPVPAYPTITSTETSLSDITMGIIHPKQTLTMTPHHNYGGRTHAVLELKHPWFHLIRRKYHGSTYVQSRRGTGAYGNIPFTFYQVPVRWQLYRFNGGLQSTAYNVMTMGMLTAPSFAYEDTYRVYFHNSAHDMDWILENTHRSVAKIPEMILEQDTRGNEVEEIIRYRLGVYTNIYQNYTRFVELWAPKVYHGEQHFQAAGPYCRVNFGFRNMDMDDYSRKTKCDVTDDVDFPLASAGQGPTHKTFHFEFYDIYHYSRRYWDQYDGFYIFEFDLKNPPVPMWTGNWEIRAYAFENYLDRPRPPNIKEVNYTRLQHYSRINIHNKSNYWVGTNTTHVVPLINYFRVYDNRETFEERRQKAGQWAEFHMRLYPKNIIPNDVGKVEIQIPTEFDIPNGGKKICQVGHENHNDLDGQFCEITNERKVSVRTNQQFGLNPVCTIVRITTEFSVENNNGFQAPPVPSLSDFDVYLWDDTRLVEFLADKGAPDAVKLEIGTDLNITTTCNEASELSVIKVVFNAKVQLRAGYDVDVKQTDIFLKQPQGRMELLFNTKDKYNNQGKSGFPVDLGYPASVVGTPYPIPCQAFNGVVPKPGEDLICELYRSAAIDFYQPVRVVIRNFQQIALNAEKVEFHLLDVKQIFDWRNNGSVEFKGYQVKGDGSIENLYDVSQVLLAGQADTGVGTVTKNFATQNADERPVFLPDVVGGRLGFTMYTSIPSYIYQFDTFEVTFPSMFEFPAPEAISAVFKIQTSPYGPANEYFFDANTILYPSISEVHFMLPKGSNIYGCTNAKPCKVYIIASGFRHASYADSNPFQLDMRVVSKLKTVQKLTYNNIASPGVAAFNSLFLTTSSQFSEDVYVDYKFAFTPSYHYPTDTKIAITLENNKFRHINKSYPPAKCVTNFDEYLKSCTILEAQIQVELKKQMPESFAAEIKLTGVKNPKFVGETGATDAHIVVNHPFNNFAYKINEGHFNTLTFVDKKNVDTLFFTINLSSNYAEVSADYEFVLQNTNRVPPLGTINILMPSEWAAALADDVKIDRVTGYFTKDKLIYSENWIWEPSGDLLLKITPEFEWPAKQQLKIKVSSIINPSGLSLTRNFKAFTNYDSETIDKSDVTDPASRVPLLPYEPKITKWLTDFSPRNEAELATYKFRLSSADRLNVGECINFVFPNNYDNLVIDYTKKLSCTSPTLKMLDCTAEGRNLKLCLTQKVEPDVQFDIAIEGIMNPNHDSFGYIDVTTSDKQGNILQFTNNVALFKTSVGAQPIHMTKVTSTSENILVKSDYQFCVELKDPVPMGAEILIDYPKQFDIRKSSYRCELGTDHNSVALPYPAGSLDCSINNNLRRFTIRGHTAAFAGAATPQSLCYKIYEVENSKDTGECFNFVLRVLDVDLKKMLYRTVGILDYPSTLYYKRSGLRIFIGDIPDIPLNTMSNDITIELEKSVPYDVVLTPQSEGFDFFPSSIDFKFHEGPKQTFRIVPKPGVVNPGEHAITWVKQEKLDNGDLRFSELPDTYFNVKNLPDYRQLRMTLRQNVYRAPIRAKSMPIIVELNQPASRDLTVYYKTRQPFQPEYIEFSPKELKFKAGEKVKEFFYTSDVGAVSGLIDVEMEPGYKDLYYCPNCVVNFEIQDLDTEPPQIPTYKMTEKRSTEMKMRVSLSESSKVYYVASFKGTETPSVAEMMNSTLRSMSTKKPSVAEIQGDTTSEITSNTRDYIYNDAYINLDGLVPDRDYTLFMLPVDLYGNIGEVKEVGFRTNTPPQPASFSLKTSSSISEKDLLDSLSLVAEIPASRFKIISTPNIANIDDSEQEVKNALKGSELEYKIMLLPDYTQDATSPYDIIKKIDDEKETLFVELPQLDNTQDIGATGSEILDDPQQIPYEPILTEISNFHANFNISLQYTGTMYGIILPSEEPAPNAIQIRYGLTSVNYQLEEPYKIARNVTVDQDKNYRIWPYEMVDFSFLYHSTYYTAYFIGDRETYGDPVLMKDDEIVAVKIKTLREIFMVTKRHSLEVANNNHRILAQSASIDHCLMLISALTMVLFGYLI